jgi:hypothetical protein
VQDRETIILGGLVRNYRKKEQSGIPLLVDIPVIGRLFGYSSGTDTRGEVVVFITPYVLENPEEISEESGRRKDVLNVEGLWQKGWSSSQLADSVRDDASAKNRKKRYLLAGETPAAEVANCAARLRFASKPYCRIRTNPLGNTCCKNRRRNSVAGSVSFFCRLSSW